MVADPTAPATKQDIALLMEEMGKLYMANAKWKEEILGELKASEGRMKLHFDTVAENMLHDFRSGWNDKFTDHEERILRLEQRAGAVRR